MNVAVEAALNIFSLPNDLHELIFSYLSFNDLKELRLTCTRFNIEVIESSTFRQRSKIFVDSNNLLEVAGSIQRNKRLNFRNVEFVEIDDCQEIASIMDTISMDVQELSLYETMFYETLGSVELPNLNKLKVNNTVTEEMSNWKLDRYKNLNNLDIAEMHNSLHNYLLEEVIKSVPGKLRSLSVRQSKNYELVTRVLKLNGNSLNYLYIELCAPPPMQLQKEWSEIFQNMMSLRSLKIINSEFCGDWIYEIVAALPETTQINCVLIKGKGEMVDRAINLIGNKFPNTITNANFNLFGNVTRSTIEEFLRVTPNLKKLSISNFNRTFDDLTLDQKPMIQELNLSGLKGLTEDSICNLAKKLPNLVHLHIYECALGATNKSLAYIFRYQTRLRTLILTFCNKITDEGLMGLGEKDWPLTMPITRLKSLETLNLRGIGDLTNQPFHEAIAFKELHEFHMPDSEYITNEAIASLVKNCPAIEKLSLSNCPELTSDALDIIAAGLKRLRKFYFGSDRHFL